MKDPTYSIMDIHLSLKLSMSHSHYSSVVPPHTVWTLLPHMCCSHWTCHNLESTLYNQAEHDVEGLGGKGKSLDHGIQTVEEHPTEQPGL